MIEIIPNWHPVFVHFTVALLSLAVGFHVICPLLPDLYVSMACKLLDSAVSNTLGWSSRRYLSFSLI